MVSEGVRCLTLGFIGTRVNEKLYIILILCFTVMRLVCINF